MWYDIFFDKNSVFQWASIAAIVSFLAFVVTLLSLLVTWVQGKKNRKSTTLVNLRLEELKDLRKEGASIISLIDKILNERAKEKEILKTDPIINELDTSFNKLYSYLYRHTIHAVKLDLKITQCKMQLLSLKESHSLIDMRFDLEEAIKEYSRIEYEEIESYL